LTESRWTSALLPIENKVPSLGGWGERDQEIEKAESHFGEGYHQGDGGPLYVMLLKIETVAEINEGEIQTVRTRV